VTTPSLWDRNASFISAACHLYQNRTYASYFQEEEAVSIADQYQIPIRKAFAACCPCEAAYEFGRTEVNTYIGFSLKLLSPYYHHNSIGGIRHTEQMSSVLSCKTRGYVHDH